MTDAYEVVAHRDGSTYRLVGERTSGTAGPAVAELVLTQREASHIAIELNRATGEDVWGVAPAGDAA